jgi:hypothetical protein
VLIEATVTPDTRGNRVGKICRLSGPDAFRVMAVLTAIFAAIVRMVMP